MLTFSKRSKLVLLKWGHKIQFNENAELLGSKNAMGMVSMRMVEVLGLHGNGGSTTF